MTITLTSDLLDPTEMRDAVDAVLEDFLAEKARSAPSPHLAGVIDTLRGFLFAGGKRIRPVMCLCGWYAAGGRGDLRPVLQAAASLELFHAFALIHDDVMDNSATRRGSLSVHRASAARHQGGDDPVDAERLGTNTAILLGDLALIWSDEMLHTAQLTPAQLRSALPVLDTMRSELMLGQYLDLIATGRPTADVDHALAISQYKTAKYTIERPLHIGAALAGSEAAVADACSAYGIPLGEAFQLRDDVLGVFGDPEATGKPVNDDLREGKCTVLMAVAVSRATPAQRGLLNALVGRPDLDEVQADSVRTILLTTGARQEVERMISNRRQAAVDALDRAGLPASVTAVLRHLAHTVSTRTA